MEFVWMECAGGYTRDLMKPDDAATAGGWTRRRRFWCAEQRREVEVEFEEVGLPGLGWSAAVRSCPVFDPPTAIACRRRCLDARFRRQWDSPLPVRMKAGG